MSDGFAYLDIIFFAMVAAFVAYRLRSVLGRKTGNERPRVDPITRRTANGASDNVVPLPEREGGAGRRGHTLGTGRHTRRCPVSPISGAPIQSSMSSSSCRVPVPRSP